METNKSELKWHIELIRIALIVIPIFCGLIWFVAGIDKQIALNTQSINTNQAGIEKMMTNEIPHLQNDIKDLLLITNEIKVMVAELQ